MPISRHRNWKIEAAEKALDEVFDDRSVSMTETRERLESLVEYIKSSLEALE